MVSGWAVAGSRGDPRRPGTPWSARRRSPGLPPPQPPATPCPSTTVAPRGAAAWFHGWEIASRAPAPCRAPRAAAATALGRRIAARAGQGPERPRGAGARHRLVRLVASGAPCRHQRLASPRGVSPRPARSTQPWRGARPARGQAHPRWRRACRGGGRPRPRSEEHTSELQSHHDLVCRLLLEKKKTTSTHQLYKKQYKNKNHI